MSYSHVTSQTITPSAGAFIEPSILANIDDPAYEYQYLKVTTSLWADGTGNVIVDEILKNNSIEDWAEHTWWFDWPTAEYSKISAVDDKGPLSYTTTMSGTRIFITVKFRNPLPIGKTYNYKLRVSIGGMASGSGDNWRANWFIIPGSIVQEYIEGITFPSTSTITSISPTPSKRNGNYLEWKKTDVPDNWELLVDIYYVLSDKFDVSLFLQSDPPWNDDIYAYNTKPEDDIERWGCFTTSGAMIVNYWAGVQDQNFRTDPGNLNTWLIKEDGYSPYPGNGVKHAWIGKYARDNKVSLYWTETTGVDNDLLNKYLRTGNPVILGVDPSICSNNRICPGHYVVATGSTTVDNEKTYSINDPKYGSTTLKEHWNDTYITLITFSSSETDARVLRFTALSPVEFVVIDPLGRKTGYDPITYTTWNEIPSAFYLLDSITPHEGSTGRIEDKYLEIKSPLDGEYQIVVYGIGLGNYTIEVSSLDWKGIPSTREFYGNAELNSKDTFNIEYHSVIHQIFIPFTKR